MKELTPKVVLKEVAEAVTEEYHGNLVVVGSLAADCRADRRPLRHPTQPAPWTRLVR